MKILVACEISGVVRDAFRKFGHDAFSCDILNSPSPFHINCSVEEVLYDEWDMVLAFPPCTHLAVSGARHFEQKKKDGRQQEGIHFFMKFTKLDHVPMVCIENPVGIMSNLYRKPNQIIQPWMFGEDASKKTCLWLKGLQPLIPTNIIKKERYSNQTPSGQNKLGPSEERAAIRSKTYLGIAQAMAEQWGK